MELILTRNWYEYNRHSHQAFVVHFGDRGTNDEHTGNKQETNVNRHGYL